MAVNRVGRGAVTTRSGVTRRLIHKPARRRSAAVSGAEFGRRIVALVFGLVQLVIGLRLVILLVGAREANVLVSGILDLSQTLVAPFEGILGTDALHAAGSVLDLAAIVALVGWTILEVAVLRAVGIVRRETASPIRGAGSSRRRTT